MYELFSFTAKKKRTVVTSLLSMSGCTFPSVCLVEYSSNMKWLTTMIFGERYCCFGTKRPFFLPTLTKYLLTGECLV